jgi:hypothetical protein
MRKLNLRELQLTIPSITMLDARKLMGGDGYIDDEGNWHLGELDPAIVKPYPDDNLDDYYDRDDDNRDYPDQDQGGPDGHGYNGSDNDTNNGNTYHVPNFPPAGVPFQAGNTCVFAAMNAIAQWLGIGNNSQWLGFADAYVDKYLGGNPNAVDFALLSSFSGVPSENFESFIGDYFNYNLINSSDFCNALADGDPILVHIDYGDINGDGVNEGHEVVIYDYSDELGVYYYWDPEDGQTHQSSEDNFSSGYQINGAK